MDSLCLTPTLLSSFKVTRSFDTRHAPLSSLSFDDAGDKCLTTAQDDSINIYDCKEGAMRNTIFSKRYGVGLARFTHHSNNIVYGTPDGVLRHLSIHDNKYIRYFCGHKERIVSLQMSPLDDKLISSSLDGTLRLWDLRSPTCEGMVSSGDRPLAAIDNSGLVFCIGSNSSVLRLYDIRSFDTGPFTTWNISESITNTLSSSPFYWTSIKFTNDGQYILITTSVGIHYLVHAFEGNIVKRLMEPSPDQQQQQLVCGESITISPDARYIFSGGGTKDGMVRIWDILNNDKSIFMNGVTVDCPILEWPSPHIDGGGGGQGINVLGFNPSLMMMASGGNQLDFWEPMNL